MKNIVSIRPVSMRTLEDVICKDFGCSYTCDGENKSGICLLTNELKMFGAAVMFYTQLLEKIAEVWKEDFYIVPSSTHEVLLLQRGTQMEPGQIKEMIMDVNKHVVPEEDVLSDNLYVFSVEQRMIIMT